MHVCGGTHGGKKGTSESPGAGIADSYATWYMCWEQNSSLLQVHVTTELSPEP